MKKDYFKKAFTKKKKSFENKVLREDQKEFAKTLSKEVLLFLLNDTAGSFLGIKAPTGIGKTTALIGFIKDFKPARVEEGKSAKVLFLTERKTSRDAVRFEIDKKGLSKIVDVECYQKYNANSEQDILKQYKFIIMDEFASYITDSNFSHNIGHAVSLLKKAEAHKVIISSNLDEELNKQILSGRNYRQITVLGKYMKNIIIEKQYTFDKQIEYTMKNFKKGQDLVVIRNNNTKENQQIKEDLTQQGFSTCMITADSGKYVMQKPEEQLLEMIKRDKQIPANVDVIVVTSVLDTSVNINVGDRKCTYIINDCFNEDTISQIAGRTRSEKSSTPTTIRISMHARIAESRLNAALNKIAHSQEQLLEIAEKEAHNLTTDSDWDTYDSSKFEAEKIQHLCKIHTLKKDVDTITLLQNRLTENPKDYYILPHLVKGIFELVDEKSLRKIVAGIVAADSFVKTTGQKIYSKMKKLRTYILGMPGTLKAYYKNRFDAYSEEGFFMNTLNKYISAFSNGGYQVEVVKAVSKKGFSYKDCKAKVVGYMSDSVLSGFIEFIKKMPIMGYEEIGEKAYKRSLELLNSDRYLESIFA
jgi:superfamily II DNA or RNA helicase